MKEIYNFVFYRMFKETFTTNRSIPEWSTMIYLSLLIMFNFISICLVLKIPIFDYGKIIIFIIITIILLLNYLYFIKDNKYREIIKYYKKNETQKIYNYLVIFYELVSVLTVSLLIGLNVYEALILTAIFNIAKLLIYLFKKTKRII